MNDDDKLVPTNKKIG
jgi:hypothetical protein